MMLRVCGLSAEKVRVKTIGSVHNLCRTLIMSTPAVDGLVAFHWFVRALSMRLPRFSTAKITAVVTGFSHVSTAPITITKYI